MRESRTQPAAVLRYAELSRTSDLCPLPSSLRGCLLSLLGSTELNFPVTFHKLPLIYQARSQGGGGFSGSPQPETKRLQIRRNAAAVTQQASRRHSHTFSPRLPIGLPGSAGLALESTQPD